MRDSGYVRLAVHIVVPQGAHAETSYGEAKEVDDMSTIRDTSITLEEQTSGAGVVHSVFDVITIEHLEESKRQGTIAANISNCPM